ncbi:hypothetical protein JCM8097_006122 [Rhodosporidiobolus ruineniae]
MVQLLEAQHAHTLEKRQKVVLLGAGLVAGPALRTLAAQENLDIVVASNDLPAAEELCSGYLNATAVELDAGDKEALAGLIRGADVVLSLLPAFLHIEVAKLCIQEKASLVTASYTSPQMAKLHEQAKQAGVVLLNELGLDPGIDHITAMRLLEQARAAGGKIKSFVSFCGGLPSPELSSAPLGYKFSWSPRGVLTAALNPATFRLNSREVSISARDLLQRHFPSVPILPGFSFEGVANRDSVSYLPEYGLEDDLPTIMRGTLRYPGFSRQVDALKRIGLLATEKLKESIRGWTDLVDACLWEKGHEVVDNQSRRIALLEVLEGDEQLMDEVLSTLDQLALLPSTTFSTPTASLPAVPSTPRAPIDLLSTILAHQLRYEPGERDAVMLHHEVTVESSTGETELFTSTLVQYGTFEISAMATTVGVPIALGALLLLSPCSSVKSRGIVAPSSDEVWRPLLVELEKAGIKAVEGRRKGRGMLDELEKAVEGWAK